MTDAAVITLMTRANCTLCEEMLAALAEWAGDRLDYRVEAVDIARDAVLERRYGMRIPVLLHDGRELCAGRFDAARAGRLLGLD